MKLENKNILVTGGLGFIGSNFINKIFNTYKDIKVINLDNKRLGSNPENIHKKYRECSEYIEVNDSINDKIFYNILLEHDVDIVIHFAAESHVDRSISSPYDFMNTNVMGTFNILESIRRIYEEYDKKIYLHHVSTDEVFGSLTIDCKSSVETDSYKPRSPYSASKASSDHLVMSWLATFKLNCTLSNCSNNYGQNQFNEKFIPVVIRSCLKQENIPIYGNGENIRDWLHVDDHCAAILDIIEHGKCGEKYNIGADNEISNISLVYMICDILDKKILDSNSIYYNKSFKLKSFRELISFVGDRPGHDQRYSVNSNKLKEHTGWKPEVDFQSGLENTVEWYISNSNRLD